MQTYFIITKTNFKPIFSNIFKSPIVFGSERSSLCCKLNVHNF